MSPTEQLKAEHEGILLMLGILGEVCVRLKSKQGANKEHISQILEFLKIFVDKCHHGKEEDLLFPALEEAGILREGGPIGVMLMEHNQGRSYIKGMKEAFEMYTSGDNKASLKIVENAENYIALLTQHIDKENNVLFKMADKVLSNEKQKELVAAFEQLEVERIGPGKHEEFHKLLHRLKEIYLN